MGKRPARLLAALTALAQQDLPREELEVVVAGDPGVELHSPPPALSLRLVRTGATAGAAAKRNLGWSQARAPLIAFTDDDCRPAPGWARALLASHERHPGSFVQGRTEPDPGEVEELWGLAHSQLIARASPWHETCNIAYPRSVLERLGGFEEGYGPLGGEDTDLGERARAAGAPKEYEEAALVWHAVERRSFRQAIREAVRTRDEPQVLARFPHLREELYLRVFYRRDHALLLLALAGALSRRPLLGAAVAIPYVRSHLRNHRLTPLSLTRAAGHLPVRALRDAIEIYVVGRRGLRRGVIAL